VTPVPLVAGNTSLTHIRDCWGSAAFGGRYDCIFKACSVIPFPLDMVSTVNAVPRHGRQGLAIFTLGHSGIQTKPQLYIPRAPLLRLAEVRTVLIDTRAEYVGRLLGLLHGAFGNAVTIRDSRRSPLSTDVLPRAQISLVLSEAVADADAVMVLQDIRSNHIGAETFFGLRSMSAAPDAILLEFSCSDTLRHCWPLCSLMYVLNGRTALVYTKATEETWTATMDRTMIADANEKRVRLRWKMSAGGRPFASPSATNEALTANKRTGRHAPSQLDYATSVTINGEIGREDGKVLGQIMDHVVRNAPDGSGLGRLKAATDPNDPKLGEYLHTATVDPSAPPGRLQVYCETEADVAELYNILNGEVLECGLDYIGVTVSNDILAARAVPKNGARPRQ